MKSIFLIRYRMGGRLECLPVYACNIFNAKAAFRKRMGNDFGVETGKYQIDSYRCIPEREIQLDHHMRFVNRLSDEDKQELFADRKARQMQHGKVDRFVVAYYAHSHNGV